MVGLLRHGLIQVLALLVVCVDALSHLPGRLVVLLHQQRHGFLAVLHTSAGIDARAYLEDDIAQ